MRVFVHAFHDTSTDNLHVAPVKQSPRQFHPEARLLFGFTERRAVAVSFRSVMAHLLQRSQRSTVLSRSPRPVLHQQLSSLVARHSSVVPHVVLFHPLHALNFAFICVVLPPISHELSCLWKFSCTDTAGCSIVLSPVWVSWDALTESTENRLIKRGSQPSVHERSTTQKHVEKPEHQQRRQQIQTATD